MFAIIDTFFFKKLFNEETKILKSSNIFHFVDFEMNRELIDRYKKYFMKTPCKTLAVIEYESIKNSASIKVKRIYNIDRLEKLELLL